MRRRPQEVKGKMLLAPLNMILLIEPVFGPLRLVVLPPQAQATSAQATSDVCRRLLLLLFNKVVVDAGLVIQAHRQVRDTAIQHVKLNIKNNKTGN